jgi:hypothetical protein
VTSAGYPVFRDDVVVTAGDTSRVRAILLRPGVTSSVGFWVAVSAGAVAVIAGGALGYYLATTPADPYRPALGTVSTH